MGETKQLLENFITENQQLNMLYEEFQKTKIENDNKVIRRLDFKEDDLSKESLNIDEFFNSQELDANVLLFVDNKNNIWELLKRKDLCIDLLNNLNYTKINSLKNYINYPDTSFSRLENNLIIEEKRDNTSINNSDLEISINTEFNSVSKVIKETINLTSEI